jgi:hypothetical protein
MGGNEMILHVHITSFRRMILTAFVVGMAAGFILGRPI